MSRKATAKKEEKIDTSLFGDTATIEKPEPVADVQTSSPESKGELVVDPAPAAAALPAIPDNDPIFRMMGMIERLATNPNVGPENLKVILDAQERIMDRNNRAAYDAAFIAMQPDLPTITKDGRIIVQEKDSGGKRTGDVVRDTPYAKWETVQEIIKPVLFKHGFAISHRIGTIIEPNGDRRVRVTAILRGHGHTDDTCYFDLAPDIGPGRNNNQAWAASVTFAKRHGAFAVLNIATRAEDDDGKSSGGPVIIGTPMTEERLASIRDFIEATGAPVNGLIKYMNERRPKKHPEAKTLEDIPEERAEEVIAALRHREAEVSKKSNPEGAKK